MGDVELRRYKLPSLNHEGWAVVVIGSDGYFSTASDWGNYAFIWGAPGMEFRKFLTQLDASYFHSKITHMREARVFDERATEKAIGKRLWEMMGAGDIDKPQHDDALEKLEGVLDDGPHGIPAWAASLDFDFEYYDVVSMMPEPQSWGYATKVLPRLQALLREELAAEADLHKSKARDE